MKLIQHMYVLSYYEEVRNAPYADRDTLAIPTQEYLPQV